MAAHQFTFPTGFHRFHRKMIYNFQFNRWHSLGFARYEDMVEAGQRIRDFSSWKTVMMELAERAEAEERLLNAAAYYRGAEFYMREEDPDKVRCYEKFSELFDRLFGEEVMRDEVPYEDGLLPVLRVPVAGEKKGTILMHGGFDSFIEEFYPEARSFADGGYEVVAFEGPGQGGARRRYGLPLTNEWERPVGAVLDHLRLEDVTIYGISMGGYWCLRAAAFEPRISRVMSSGGTWDYMQSAPKVASWLMWFFFTYLREFTNRQSYRAMRKSDQQAWMIWNLMYITKAPTPMDAMEFAMQMNGENQHAERISQDVLLLVGEADHFVPFKRHHLQTKALTAARSVTEHVFEKGTHAEHHCQIGNIGLGMDVELAWLDGLQ